MNIVIAASECMPFARGTFLGETIYTTAKSLESLGHKVHIFIPRYGFIDPQGSYIERIPVEIKTSINGSTVNSSIFKGVLPGSFINVFLIESQHHFSNSKEIYPAHLTREEIQDRSIFFASTILESIFRLKLNPDIIHLFNEGPAQISSLISSSVFNSQKKSNPKIILSVQGLESISMYPSLIPSFSDALSRCDLITITSDLVKKELQAEKDLYTLFEVLERKRDSLVTASAFNYEELYNPETDNDIAQKYSKGFFTVGKRKCKEELCSLFGFETNLQSPTIFATTLQSNIENEILKALIINLSGMELNFAITTNGQEITDRELIKLAAKTRNVRIKPGGDFTLIKKLYSGSDFFLSLLSCHSNISPFVAAMKFGCIPIPLLTPITNELKNCSLKENDADFITYDRNSPDEIIKALTHACTWYKNKEKWTFLVRAAMSISNPLKEKSYLELYNKMPDIKTLTAK